jgi:hypothetical protein
MPGGTLARADCASLLKTAYIKWKGFFKICFADEIRPENQGA